MFPLGMVVFPSEPVPLHIFEPRYRQLVADCERDGGEFGVVMSDGKTAQQVGCALVIDEILERMDDGRVNLLAKGTRRFVVENWINGEPDADPDDLVDGKLYDRAVVRWMDDTIRDWDEDLATGVFSLHRLLLQLVRQGRAPDSAVYSGLNHLSFTTGFAVGMDPMKKQKLLEMRSENERLEAITAHLTELIPQLKAVAELQHEIDQKWQFMERED